MKVFLLGGFLGSGKTTAIQQAAIKLQEEGKKVGVITNDQGEQLVDTRFMQQHNIAVEEVTGSCFCCNFKQLSQRIQTLQETNHPEIIFAESVGSCMDLVATIIKPLQNFYKNIDTVLSVFTDIRLLGVFLQRNKDIFYGKMNYIYEKQLEEADIIVVNKSDTLNEMQMQTVRELINEEPWVNKVLYQNSLNPSDIQRWLDTVNNFKIPGSRESLDINYDDYAMGEAEMAWYDSEVEIVTRNGSAGEIGYRFISNIYDKIKEQQYIIGHLKFLISDKRHFEKVSYTTIPITTDFDSHQFRSADKITIIINARVKADPASVDRIITESLTYTQSGKVCSIKEKNKKVFQPGYPTPTYRMLS